PWSSPLGPMHHQPPSDQASAVRALLAAFSRRRRNHKCPSSPSSPTKQRGSPGFECALEHSSESTYTPLDSRDASAPPPPPPPYSEAVARASGPGLEEDDLVVLDEWEQPSTGKGVVQVETKQERKERDRLERTRFKLVADDARINDELVKMGFL
ncbi:hypothetical protein DMC30DRAFT_441758, partial [Rhodotorula diobovata]